MSNTSTIERPVHLREEATAGAAPESCTRCHCETCCVGSLCLPGGLTDDDLRPLAALSLTTRRFSAGEGIYSDGDRFRYVYAIRSGTCKTSMIRVDGREQVTGFHLAGDFIGLDGLAEGTHGTSAAALEDARLCLIPYQRLALATALYPNAKDLLTHVMGQEIVRDHQVLTLLGQTEAPQRLAAFLLDLSQRYAARGWSPREFRLPMSRTDIASFLGLKMETVSRTLTLFERRGLLAKRGRSIQLTDVPGLRAMCGLHRR